MKPSILFCGNKKSEYCEYAIEYLKTHFDRTENYLGTEGDRLPEDIGWWKGDYIITYDSPWIVPGSLIDRAKEECINFHPGPPEYPGVGSVNFAIYNNEDSFGVTCHHITPDVFYGQIIAVKKFCLLETDTVYSLTQRLDIHLLSQFYDIMDIIIKGKKTQKSNDSWKREPYSAEDLLDLKKLTHDMDKKEVHRRIRALTRPNETDMYTKIGDIKFKCEQIDN